MSHSSLFKDLAETEGWLGKMGLNSENGSWTSVEEKRSRRMSTTKLRRQWTKLVNVIEMFGTQALCQAGSSCCASY